MAEIKQTLLFIPDISGFTKFVNSTEISHSEHIISELLEIIINSDQNNMVVSEIEGDAVLFYKDSVPDSATLIKQCVKTYQNFHNHLHRYNVERICRCGACESASKLSLKFIIHTGEVKKINIKDHNKLHGSDVILAHRLMKNSIPGNEYIMFSENINFDKAGLDKEKYSWAKLETGQEKYNDIGEIGYSYIALNDFPLKKKDISSITFPELSAGRLTFKNVVHAPVDKVYENFTDFDKRLEWNEEIREIIVQDNKLNQSGSLHTCIVGNQSLNIESIGRIEDEKNIVYGERLNKFKGLRDLISIYTFEIKGDETIIKVEVDFKVKSIISRLLKNLIRKMIQKQTERNLQKLKIVSEK